MKGAMPIGLLILALLYALLVGAWQMFDYSWLAGGLFSLLLLPTLSFLLRTPAHFRREQEQLQQETLNDGPTNAHPTYLAADRPDPACGGPDRRD